jgi:hypothetical protein
MPIMRLIMAIIMPETCLAVSVGQSNKILRLIVASIWVFYLSDWRCTAPQTLNIHCLKDRRTNPLRCWSAFVWVSCSLVIINCCKVTKKHFLVYCSICKIVWRNFHIKTDTNIWIFPTVRNLPQLPLPLETERAGLLDPSCRVDKTKKMPSIIFLYIISSFFVFLGYLHEVVVF